MPGMDEYTVGQVAQLSSVTVRTLHHYDEVGLLAPSGRSEAGYRLYSATDLGRLRRILFYRELDFSLERIGALLDRDGLGAAEHLRAQHRLLRRRLDRTEQLLHAIEDELEARSMGISLTPEEQLEIFGPETPAKHEAEAEQRWGHTEAWRESRRAHSGLHQAGLDRDQGRHRRQPARLRPGARRRCAGRRRGRPRQGRGTPRAHLPLVL